MFDKIGIDLNMSVVDIQSKARLAQVMIPDTDDSTEKRMAWVETKCTGQCEDEEIRKTSGLLVENAATTLLERLGKQQETRYRLIVSGLTRENRAGIEAALDRLPGYISHHVVRIDEIHLE